MIPVGFLLGLAAKNPWSAKQSGPNLIRLGPAENNPANPGTAFSIPDSQNILYLNANEFIPVVNLLN